MNMRNELIKVIAGTLWRSRHPDDDAPDPRVRREAEILLDATLPVLLTALRAPHIAQSMWDAVMDALAEEIGDA